MSERKTRLSMSAIETYQRCPRQLYLGRFVEPALPAKKTPPMLLGSAIHHLVEVMEKEAPADRRFYCKEKDSLVGLWSHYWRTAVEKALGEGTLITSEKDFNPFPYYTIGRTCLENYWDFFYDRPKPRSVEERIDIKFANGWSFRAILDQVREIQPDWIERNYPLAVRNRELFDPVAIIDLKSGKGDYDIGELLLSSPELTDQQIRKQFSLHEGNQATAYVWAYWVKYGRLPVVFYWYHMRSGKFYPTFRNPDHFKNLQRKIAHVIQNVEAGSFPTHEGFDCQSCPYIEYCPEGREFLLVKPRTEIAAAGEQIYYTKPSEAEFEKPKQLRLGLQGVGRKRKAANLPDVYRGPKKIRLIGFEDEIDFSNFESLQVESVS